MRSGLESIAALLGFRYLRCQDCGLRQRVNLLLLSKVRYAKCPRCLELQLSTWDPKYYRVSQWRRLLMQLGAKRYRCHSCRYNFVSFRARAAVAPVSRR